jgi:hypothetical protein
MDTLPESDREVLQLFYWDGLDLTGVAHVLGISSNAAGTRLSRAKSRFLEHFQLGSPLGTNHGPSDITLRERNEAAEGGDTHD